MEINYEQLRRDLIDFYEGAFFIGGFGAAIFDISKIYNASNEELISIANELNFNLNKYINNGRHR